MKYDHNKKISKIRKKSRSQKNSRKTSKFQNFSGKSRRSGNTDCAIRKVETEQKRETFFEEKFFGILAF
jgi:hypothetical protein